MVNPVACKPVPAKLPRIAVYLASEKVKADLERLALSERRSVSQMAAILIEQGLEKAKKEGKLQEQSDS